MSEQKVSVSMEQHIIKFLTAEESYHWKFLRGSKNSLKKHVSPELECSNGVKPSERGESGEHAYKRDE